MWTFKPCRPQREQPALTVIGPTSSVGFHITKGDQESLVGSVLSRVLLAGKTPPTPVLAAFFNARAIAATMPEFNPRISDPGYRVRPWTVEYWESRFPVAQRLKFRRLRSWMANGGTTNDQRTTIFTKREKKSIRIRNHYELAPFEREHVDDRNINACEDSLKVRLGPHICAWAEAVARNLNYRNWLFFDLSATDEEVGEWYTSNLKRFGVNKAIEIDCSRIDATHNEQTLGLLADLARNYGLPEDIVELLEQQLNNVRATSRNGVGFLRRPFLKSGVPNTTITNTLVCCIAFTLGVIKAGGQPGRDCALMAKGDDSFGFCNPELKESALQAYKDFGFIPKCKYGHPQEEHSFCSNNFYPVGDHYEPAPTYRALRGLFVTHSDVPVKKYKSFILGVCLGLRKICNKVPIFHAILENCIAHMPHRYDNVFKQAQKEIRVKLMQSQHTKSVINEQSWAWASRRLGLSVGALKCAERELLQAHSIAFQRDNPACYVYTPFSSLLDRAIEKALVT